MTDSLWRKRQEPEAMTLALEALKNTTPTGFNMESDKKFFAAIKALEEALAKQEQGEPVAWPCLIVEADFSQNTVTLAMQCEDYKVSAGQHWLSTTPQQRTWVGLTDREKSNLWLESRAGIPRFHTYATLVEAKLKQKNMGNT